MKITKALLAIETRTQNEAARLVPAHQCKVCGAQWVFVTDKWSLVSKTFGGCCSVELDRAADTVEKAQEWLRQHEGEEG